MGDEEGIRVATLLSGAGRQRNASSRFQKDPFINSQQKCTIYSGGRLLLYTLVLKQEKVEPSTAEDIFIDSDTG